MTNTHCALAYHGITINQDGSLDPCCQYTNRPDFTRIPFTQFDRFKQEVLTPMHQDFVAGRPHIGCQKCYTEEAAGWTTLRQYANRWYGESNDFNNHIRHIELRLGNFCNLKCIMCSPGSSSSISVERQQHKEKFKEIGIYPYAPKMEHYWETNEFFQFSEHLLSRVERVNITGGEPFMIPEVLTILDRLLLVKDTVCISFNTNMTILTEKILSRLEQFKNLEISVSLEGIGAMNDYLRYPSKWEEIAENIQTVQKRIPTAHVSVNHTFQHASVYSLPALAEFCYVNKISLHMTLVQGMEWLTFDSVPPNDIKQLILWAAETSLLAQDQKMFIVNILHASKFDFDLYQQHQDYVAVLDSIRGTNFNQVFNPTFEQLQFNF